MQPFVVAAVAFRRDDSVLTVRKRDTRHFMLPGGKLESGEHAEDAARREVAEEVGIRVEDLKLLGKFTAPAANELGRTVQSTVFQAALREAPRAGGEIAEVRWSSLAQPAPDLAPLLRDYVLPALRARH